MRDIVKKDESLLPTLMHEVEGKIAVIRNVEVIADADVAELYGVETKRINEAVRNNPDKFPARYMFELNKSELQDLRSKISSTNVSAMKVQLDGRRGSQPQFHQSLHRAWALHARYNTKGRAGQSGDLRNYRNLCKST